MFGQKDIYGLKKFMVDDQIQNVDNWSPGNIGFSIGNYVTFITSDVNISRWVISDVCIVTEVCFLKN